MNPQGEPALQPAQPTPLAEKLKEIVKATGLAQNRFAARVIVKNKNGEYRPLRGPALSNYLSGKRRPRWETVEAIVAVAMKLKPDLNVSPAELRQLWEGEPPPPPPLRTEERPKPRARWWRRRLVAVLAAGLVVILAAAGGGFALYRYFSTPGRPDAWVSKYEVCTTTDMDLRIVSSPEKAELLDDLARQYQAHRVNGQCVKVKVEVMSSGTARDLLVNGWEKEQPETLSAQLPEKPDAWSPASSVWAFPVNGVTGLLPATPTEADSLFTSPVVIAVLEPVAKDHGWLGRQVGWPEVLHAAESETFRFAKTNLNVSTSGLIATIAAFSAFAERPSTDLPTPDDVADAAVQARMKRLEAAVAHSQETTLDLLATLRTKIDAGEDQARRYLSAMAIEENSLVMFNQGYPCGARKTGCGRREQPDVKLVPVYPATGTPGSDHPLMTLTDDPNKQAIVADFRSFVRSPATRQAVLKDGFRPVGSDLLPPGIEKRDVTVPTTPPGFGGTLDKIREVWPRVRKPLNVILAVDVSGSMRGDGGSASKINLVKDVRAKLIGTPAAPTFADDDRVALWQFAGTHQKLVAPAPLSSPGHRALLQQKINDLRPVKNAPTSLCDTIRDAVNELRKDTDDRTANAVIVLTDGDDKERPEEIAKQVKELLPDIRPAKNQPKIPVFAIAFGNKADEVMTIDGKKNTTPLQAIADATDGLRGDSSDIGRLSTVFQDLVATF